jgi:RNA polymerase sigma factor (TIGR02999 family)
MDAASSNSGPETVDHLAPLVYQELRRIARAQRRRAPSYETMNTTAVVHEAYLRLSSRDDLAWESRVHFYRIASRAMRDVIVSYARRKQAAKRGGANRDLELDEDELVAEDLKEDEVLALHEALDRLQTLDARQAQIVELRYFVGLTIEETAEVLEISPATVKREWTTARAWLLRDLDGDA